MFYVSGPLFWMLSYSAWKAREVWILATHTYDGHHRWVLDEDGDTPE